MVSVMRKNIFKIAGKHVLAMWLVMFGTIISVNLFMVTMAIDSFPGIIVKNAHIASQGINDRKNAQEALGWTPELVYTDRELRLTMYDGDGVSQHLIDLNVVIGRNTTNKFDKAPQLLPNSGIDGTIFYSSPLSLESGKWFVEIKAKSLEGVFFNQRLDLVVD